jgi:prepilin-type processing-associated H-X9-DG protein
VGPELLGNYNAVLEAVSDTCSGSLVIATGLEKPPLLLAWSTASQAEIMRRIQALGIRVEEREGVLKLALAGHPDASAVVRDGRIVASAEEAALRKYLAAPPDAAHSLLSLPGMGQFMETEEFFSATLFQCSAQSDVALESVIPDAPFHFYGVPLMTPVKGALQRRFLAAVGFDATKPSAVYCKVTDQEIRLGCIFVKSLEAKREAEPAADLSRLPLSLGKSAPAFACGWQAPSFAAFVDNLAGSMDRFDPDVGAEFRDKMGELDRDLGYSFQNDLLGLLGPDWMWVAAADPLKAPQVFICSLKDREAFIVRAAKLAAISQAPWERLPDLAGAQRFRTKILVHPVELALRENALLISSSEAFLEKALQPGAWAKPAEGALLKDFTCPRQAASGLLVSINVPVLAATSAEEPSDADAAKLFTALSKLPAATTLTLELGQTADRMRIELGVTGLRPSDIHTALAAFGEALKVPQEQERRRACVTNLAEIMKALSTYQGENKDAMPPKLADLSPKFIGSEQFFHCPSAQNDDKPMPHYGYVFIPAEDVGAMGPNTVVVYDNEGNHAGGRNVGFLDGHVKWMPEPEFQAALKKTFDDLAKAKAAREVKGVVK